MDRDLITSMVEDYWRTYVPAAQRGSANDAFQAREQFEDRIQQTAVALSPIERAAFLQFVDSERNRLLDEYEADPAGLKRRLGIGLGADQPPRRASGGSRLGQVAAETAVRATVWQGIRALFSSFR